MKRFKKFMGVFLALVMVVGTIGMMPTVEAKAAELATSKIQVEKPVIGSGKTEVKVLFEEGVYNNTIKEDDFVNIKVIHSAGGNTALTIKSATYDSISKTATVVVNEYVIIVGDTVEVTLNSGGANGTALNVWANSSDYYLAGPYTSLAAEDVIPTVPGVPASAPSVRYNVATQTLEVTTQNGEEAGFVYVGIPKNDKVKAYDVFQMEDNAIDIDLSVYGVKKDVVLWIHFGNAAKLTTVSIAKNDTKIKAKYVPNAATDAAKFTFDGLDATKVAGLEYRVGSDPTWRLYDADQLATDAEFASMYGTTIYFREAAIDATAATYKFPSAEAKIKIAKRGNAPKVTVDYLKGEVKFPKDVEVLNAKLQPSDAGVISEWKPLVAAVGKAATAKLSDLVVDVSEPILFHVRLVATDKKPISKIASVSLSGQSAAPETTGQNAAFKYENVKNKGVVTGIKLTNQYDGVLEYAIVEASKTESDVSWKKLTKGKDVTIKDSSIDGKKLYYRASGVKATATITPALVSAADFVTISTKESVTFAAAVDPATGATTKIKITFSADVTGLAASNITIDTDTGTATKGALTGSGKNYEIAVTPTVTGTVTVKIANFGNSIVTPESGVVVTVTAATP